MINKQCSYSCVVNENKDLITYDVIPNVTIFRSGKLWYYLDENEKIRYVENEGISIFNLGDVNVEKVSFFKKEQYLFLRQIYKLIKCRFMYKSFNNIMLIYDEKENELLIKIRNLDKYGFKFCEIFTVDALEKEGIFNDIL